MFLLNLINFCVFSSNIKYFFRLFSFLLHIYITYHIYIIFITYYIFDIFTYFIVDGSEAFYAKFMKNHAFFSNRKWWRFSWMTCSFEFLLVINDFDNWSWFQSFVQFIAVLNSSFHKVPQGACEMRFFQDFLDIWRFFLCTENPTTPLLRHSWDIWREIHGRYYKKGVLVYLKLEKRWRKCLGGGTACGHTPKEKLFL